jgi:hypothetical protein
MGKLASDVCSTVISLLVFAADTVHIDLVLIGWPTMQGVDKCFGLNRIYGPMLHIPEACALDAAWMFILEAGLLLCWASSI